MNESSYHLHLLILLSLGAAMKTPLSLLAALLAIACLVLPANADGAIQDGFTTSGDGIYWNAAGQAYVKKYWTNWSVSGYDCYGTPKWYYTGLTYTYEPVALPKTSSYDQRRQFALGLAKSRQDAQNYAEKIAREHQLEVDLFRSLGLYFPSEGFGRSALGPTLPGYASQAGSLGQTAYGATTFNMTRTQDVYGILDPNVADQQSSMLVQQGLDFAKLSFTQRMDWLNQERARAANLAGQAIQATGKAAVVTATGQAASQALRAAKPQPESHTTDSVTVTKPTPLSDAGPQLPPLPPKADAKSAFQTVFASCTSCHSTKKATGSFNYEAYNPDNAAEFIRVARYIAPDAPKDRRCPKNADPLSPADYRLALMKGK